ncbi:hypothetical protein GCK72_022861 [Caenorhabditis remanei]|uniref:Uncharacterized protein n=1 Tax=Caenorhabditis remanei TaxID=31234 RepID=A0A6A5FUZ9_CAERE|nr:hypothetical protein GCK72_022861 [Caenorhabditis remanei]KAF1746407.1 hypothetical protein GCK72_022861 [Caenorhabditis remanei]
MRALLSMLVIACFNGSEALIRRKHVRNNNITQFNYHVQLSCSAMPYFCYYGYYLEFDWLSPDDMFTHIPFHCGSGVSHHYAQFSFFGDDRDDWHKDLHPFIEIYHNCTRSHNVLQITRNFDRVAVNGSRVEESIAIAAIDKGVPTMVEINAEFMEHSYKVSFISPDVTARAKQGINHYPAEIKDWLQSKTIHLDASEVNKNTTQVQFVDHKLEWIPMEKFEEEGSGVAAVVHNP